MAGFFFARPGGGVCLFQSRPMVASESVAETSGLEFEVRLRRTGASSARLHVAASGIQLNPTRHSLLPFAEFAGRFVASSQIDNVYREASCIRVEYRAGVDYQVLQFWARDTGTAARIVASLPTART